MDRISPIGRSVRDEMSEHARLDPKFRAELERLRPFEEVARQIIRLRMDHGLTQEALAERVGTTKSAISRLESGQHAPNLATLGKIAAAFDGRLEIAFHVAGVTPPPQLSRVQPATAPLTLGRHRGGGLIADYQDHAPARSRPLLTEPRPPSVSGRSVR